MVQSEQATSSAANAAYGASGVAADQGSPTVVAAYNAGNAQLSRMDQAYNANLSAMDSDWKGAMSTYQANLTRETSKQFQYASDMADWTKQAAYAGAQSSYEDALNMSKITALEGIAKADAILSNSNSAISSGLANYNSSMANASATSMAGISSAINGIGSAANSIGTAAYYTRGSGGLAATPSLAKGIS
jgi:hypothetical protein